MDDFNAINGLNVSRETSERLDIFSQELLKWNKTINLVSKKSITIDFFQRHIIDSLQLIPLLQGESITDLGSGAGFPGIIIALASDLKVTLIESDKRKVAFLNHIAGKFNLSCNVFSTRVEQTKIETNIITSRAFASIERTIELISANNDIQNKQLFLLKGENYSQEIDDAKRKWLFDFKKIDSITNIKSKVILISNINRK